MASDIREQWATEDRQEVIARDHALARLLGRLDFALDTGGLSDTERLAKVREAVAQWEVEVRAIVAVPRT